MRNKEIARINILSFGTIVEKTCSGQAESIKLKGWEFLIRKSKLGSLSDWLSRASDAIDTSEYTMEKELEGTRQTENKIG